MRTRKSLNSWLRWRTLTRPWPSIEMFSACHFCSRLHLKMAFFSCGGVRLLVGVPPPGFTPQRGSAIYFHVPDIGAVFETLQEAGVHFQAVPHVAHHTVFRLNGARNELLRFCAADATGLPRGGSRPWCPVPVARERRHRWSCNGVPVAGSTQATLIGTVDSTFGQIVGGAGCAYHAERILSVWCPEAPFQ